jgi:DNA adenine methylase
MIVSPLRYPGGKAKLYHLFVEIIKANSFYEKTYCEPYAGGAGLALKLLSNGFVERIALNDLDPAVFAFWHSVFYETDKLCALIETCEITIDEWHRQKSIWQSADLSDKISLGFSTFFLNRTNRSGIIDGAGPIGGYAQSGPWKLDVRFNRENHISNINHLSKFKKQINLTNEDALVFINRNLQQDTNFIYLDPPYYVKGQKLYKNFYEHSDHVKICEELSKNLDRNWIVSYDYTDKILEIYKNFSPIIYNLNYSAGKKGLGTEVIFTSHSLKFPDTNGFIKAA